MVKKVKSIPSYPNGVPGLRIKYPFWDEIPSMQDTTLKGIHRGEILYFKYRSRVANEHKINVNPMVLFQGIDRNGNLMGSNLMFFNAYIDPQTGQKFVFRNKILSVIETLNEKHFDVVYKNGKRKPFLLCERQYYSRIFGAKIGSLLSEFWRVYDIKKMYNVQNIPPDSALTILSRTPAKYVKSKDAIG